ncbi:hypothetical protein GQ600_24382 [Phytophthora cactorum]|nr:hypothetical protein GQ600_24382 [Phytophthora cactorum]
MESCYRAKVKSLHAAVAKAETRASLQQFQRRGSAGGTRFYPASCRTGGKPVDEYKSLPLLDISSFEVSKVAISYILDFVYYQDGQRTLPPGVKLGATIFEIQTQHNIPEQNLGDDVVLIDGLSDSDDDNEPQGTERQARGSAEPEAKRRRVALSPTFDHGGSAAVERLHNLKSRCAGNLQLQEHIDQLNSLRRAGLAVDASAQVLPRQPAEVADKNQFHTTGTQAAIYQTFVDDTYVSMKAQRFVAFVQIPWRKFGFFPRPAVLRGLLGWDFGTRGHVILQFCSGY